MILHTLNASPGTAAFNDCLAVIAPGDTLLLLGNGVYAALDGTPACKLLAACGADIRVLHADAAAAGVLAQIGAALAIGMAGFVELSERHPRQQAWY